MMCALVSAPEFDARRVVTQLIRAAFPFDQVPDPAPQVATDEWRVAAEWARQQRLAPLAYASFKRLGQLRELPGSTCDFLWETYINACVANWLAFQELGDLLAQFEREHIAVIVLKGAALANSLYSDPALRPIGDIDVLIRFTDTPRVGTLLVARGFTPAWEPIENFHARFSYDQVFVRGNERPMSVEAHWHLFSLPYYRERIPIEWFWQRTMPLQVDGHPARMFSPEAQIVHLAAHAVLHHQGLELLAAYDLALVLTRYRTRINWDEVLSAARAFELSRVLLVTLDQVRQVWGVSIPDDVRMQLVRSSNVRERLLFAINTASRVEARHLWDGMNQPGGKSKLLYFWHAWFPSRQYMQKRYGITNPRTLPFHYLWRLGRGVGMFVRSVVSMVGNVAGIVLRPPKILDG